MVYLILINYTCKEFSAWLVYVTINEKIKTSYNGKGQMKVFSLLSRLMLFQFSLEEDKICILGAHCFIHN